MPRFLSRLLHVRSLMGGVFLLSMGFALIHSGSLIVAGTGCAGGQEELPAIGEDVPLEESTPGTGAAETQPSAKETEQTGVTVPAPGETEEDRVLHWGEGDWNEKVWAE